MTATVQIFPTGEDVAAAAARRLAALAGAAVSARGRCLICLAGGTTPRALHRMLAGDLWRSRIPWNACHIFWGDDRCVPPTDPGSNYGQAQVDLLSKVPVPAAHIHRVMGELEPAAAATSYAAELAFLAPAGQAWPAFDLVFLGLGRDGHTASLFPGERAPDEATAATLAVNADYEGRPAERVTLTPAVFNAARQVVFLVTGSAKAKAVAATLADGADPGRWPARRITPTGGPATWMLDQAAAAGLT